jgi:hypothetical protein
MLRLLVALLPTLFSAMRSRRHLAIKNLAGLYSLVATCKANGVNPVANRTDVLLGVQTHPASRIDELLPHN